MGASLDSALRDTLRASFALRKSRLESLCLLVIGGFVARTVNLSHLACHFPGRAQTGSNYRRLQCFFELKSSGDALPISANFDSEQAPVTGTERPNFARDPACVPGTTGTSSSLTRW
jgi:hypothetical protein